MDDGPEPMKNLKPTQKNLNSADQFWREHQAGYEDRAKPSVNRMNRVHKHNSAYPKLRDELDKRRSIEQVKMIYPNNNTRYDMKCKACMKLKQMSELRKLNIRPKCKPRTTKRMYNKERKSRVKKRTGNQRKRMKYCNRKRGSSYNCVQVADKYTGMEDMYCIDDAFIQRKDMARLQDNKKSQSKENSVTNSIRTLNSPDTSDPSITSYNTFASMDHEPMVSMD